MKNQVASTNVSFDFLKHSDEFLFTVLNNISSAVLLLNKNMELQAFNDSLKTIFSNKKDEDLLYMRCGEAIGCAYQIDEAVDCGKSSKCCTCELRVAALSSYVNDDVIFKNHIKRPFYTKDGEKVQKDLQFSTRLFSFHGDKYIMLIVEDVSSLMHQNINSEK